MKNETKIYVINALTNMHVGSGDVNYGVIDNLIQRDPITDLPNINASGLKGALREAYEVPEFVNDIFGSAPKDTDNKKQGGARFFEASLLSLPVRSDKAPYLLATSVDLIKAFAERINLFGGDKYVNLVNKLNEFVNLIEDKVSVNKAVVFDSKYDNATIEVMDLKASSIEVDLPSDVAQVLGGNLVVVSHEYLKELCDNNHLPVIARNNLENGQSKNLWYEQILPKYSRLYFMVMNVNCQPSMWSDFTTNLANDIYQIGANATIGYGFCKFNEVSNS